MCCHTPNFGGLGVKFKFKMRVLRRSQARKGTLLSARSRSPLSPWTFKEQNSFTSSESTKALTTDWPQRAQQCKSDFYFKATKHKAHAAPGHAAQGAPANTLSPDSEQIPIVISKAKSVLDLSEWFFCSRHLMTAYCADVNRSLDINGPSGTTRLEHAAHGHPFWVPPNALHPSPFVSPWNSGTAYILGQSRHNS